MYYLSLDLAIKSASSFGGASHLIKKTKKTEWQAPPHQANATDVLFVSDFADCIIIFRWINSIKERFMYVTNFFIIFTMKSNSNP